RTMGPGIGIYSDGAVSCLIGPAGTGEFDVIQVTHESSSQMGTIELQTDATKFITIVIDGVRRLIQRTLNSIGRQPSEIRRVFLGNYTRHIAMMYANLSNCSEQQCFFDNLPRFSHAYACDPLINLADSHEQKS